MTVANSNSFKAAAILILLAFVGLACNYFPSPGSENKLPAKTADEVTIWFNGEKIGGLDALPKLKEKTSSIYRERENEGVFAEGTNIVISQVYLILDANLSLKNVSMVMDSLSGPVNIPGSGLKALEGKPDPLLLVVNVQDPDAGKPEIPNYPAFRRYGDKGYIKLEIKPVDDTLSKKERNDALLYSRLSRDSLVIDSSGSFFINEKQDLTETSGKELSDFPVKQRRIAESALNSEVQRITNNGEERLFIITSENLDYETIKEVIRQTGEMEKGYEIQLIPNGE